MLLVKKVLGVFAISMMIFSCNKETQIALAKSTKVGQLFRTTTPKRFLFDATKAEIASTAGWVICKIPAQLHSDIQVQIKL